MRGTTIGDQELALLQYTQEQRHAGVGEHAVACGAPRGLVPAQIDSPQLIGPWQPLSSFKRFQGIGAPARLAAAMSLATMAVCGVLPLPLVAMPVQVTATSAGVEPVVATAPAAPRAAHAQVSRSARAAEDEASVWPAQAMPPAPAKAVAPSAGMEPVVVTAPAAPRAAHAQVSRSARAAEDEASVWPAQAMPPAPATHSATADVLGAESLHNENAYPMHSSRNSDLDRTLSVASGDAQAAAHDALAAGYLQQDRVQEAQDALQEASKRLAALDPEVARAKQDAQRQAREAEQQIREVTQQHRQAQYAHADGIRQAGQLPRYQPEMGQQPARQDRVEAAHWQQEVGQAQRQQVQTQADAKHAPAEAEQAQNNQEP